MGGYDKFRNANKLFWDSSRTTITKIPGSYVESHSHYEYILKKYFIKYGIDIFDEENINKLFDFYFWIVCKKTPKIVYANLKEIQRASKDYVTDFSSYEKCLKKYYEIHGDVTVFLVKIFAERYELERFNITKEDVLDDLHKIMDGRPLITKNGESEIECESMECSTTSHSKNINNMWSAIQTNKEMMPISENSYGCFLSEYEWQYRILEFSQCVIDYIDTRTWGDSFYISNYICPKCGEFMLKSNVGERVAILTNKGPLSLRSTFACLDCKKLYAAMRGQKLSNGECFVMENSSIFDNVMEIIDDKAYSIQELNESYSKY